MTHPAPTPHKLRRRTRQLLVWAALLGALLSGLFMAGHSRYGLFDVDEAIFTQATLEMRAAADEHGLGALTMPTYNGEPRYHKPPLIYWAQSLAMDALGEHSLNAARLPSALAMLLATLLLGYATWRITGSPRWGLMAAALFGLNISVVVVARAATADGLLNLTSLALALWVLRLLFPPTLPPVEHADKPAVVARLRAVQRHLRWQRWGWIGTALLAIVAFLAKGPIAWVPAALIAGTLLLARPDHRAVWRVLAPVRTLLLTLIGLAPWAALLVHQHGWGFFYEFFMVHNVQRFAGGFSNTQSTFAGYYLIVVCVGFFPWVALLPSALAALSRTLDRRVGWLNAVRSALASPEPRVALPWLALVWAVGYIGMFSFSQTKLAHYIVPAYPALALLAGWWLAQPTRRMLPLWGTALATCWGLLLAAVLGAINPLLALLGPAARTPDAPLDGPLAVLHAWFGFAWPLHDTLAMEVLALPVDAGYGFPAAAALVALSTLVLMAMTRGLWRLMPALISLWGLALAVIVGAATPVVWAYTQAPLSQLAQALRALPPDVQVVHLGLHKPSVRMISGQPFVKLERALQLPPLLARAPETWVLTETGSVPDIRNELATTRLGALLAERCTGGYCLLVIAPLAKTL